MQGMDANKSLHLLNECERPTRKHYVILGMAWAGWLFDFYDLMLFSFLLIPIKRTLGLSDTSLSFLLGATLASTALGGIFFGYLADRVGKEDGSFLDDSDLLVGQLCLRPRAERVVVARLPHHDRTRCRGRVGDGADPGGRDVPCSRESSLRRGDANGRAARDRARINRRRFRGAGIGPSLRRGVGVEGVLLSGGASGSARCVHPAIDARVRCLDGASTAVRGRSARAVSLICSGTPGYADCSPWDWYSP